MCTGFPAQDPTQRENTQREGWAFQQWPEGKSKVGLDLPRGPGESHPARLGRSSLEPLPGHGDGPHPVGGLAVGKNPQGWATQGMKGQVGGWSGQPPWPGREAVESVP